MYEAFRILRYAFNRSRKMSCRDEMTYMIYGRLLALIGEKIKIRKSEKNFTLGEITYRIGAFYNSCNFAIMYAGQIIDDCLHILNKKVYYD